jgi:hypothetical protein
MRGVHWPRFESFTGTNPKVSPSQIAGSQLVNIVWGDQPAAPHFAKQLHLKERIISFAPLKQEQRVPYLGHFGLVETDERILVVHPDPSDESPGYFQSPLWGS